MRRTTDRLTSAADGRFQSVTPIGACDEGVCRLPLIRTIASRMAHRAHREWD